MRVAIARRPGYTRTCAQCGTTWHVPRSARRWRSRLASRFLAGLAVITGGLVEADPAVMANRQAFHDYWEASLAEVTRPPLLGEHTAELLEALCGVDADGVAKLRAQGVA